MLDFVGSWEGHLLLVDFSYSNSYHVRIGIGDLVDPCLVGLRTVNLCWLDRIWFNNLWKL